MLELFQITNDPELAARCDALGGIRLFVDLERMGKAERQAGLNTFISAHQLADVGRIKEVLRQSRLMVRVNPLHAGSAAELDAVLAQGADMVMLPMFRGSDDLGAFCALVDGRVPVVALLENADALASLASWVETPGLSEVFVGLNDLHLSLGCRFMFEPLASGLVDHVAAQLRARGMRFGFGGIARPEEGLLPGRDVLAEHLRLGSAAVILSRTFNRADTDSSFDADVRTLRRLESALKARTAEQVEADRVRIAGVIGAIAAGMPERPPRGALA